MCRILLLADARGLDPQPHLDAFRELSRTSREYQGHGWGCAWLDGGGQWQMHHDIRPVWEDRSTFAPTTLFLAHARSAFRDEGIAVENNMPFFDGTRMFAFNGELQGVRLKAEGRIGAEKIFNTIRRFDRGDITAAARRGVDLINRRTRYVRAMNFLVADAERVVICCQFGEDPDYFQLHTCEQSGLQIVCSAPYDAGAGAWRPVANRSVTELPLAGS